jgi:hypothetical protein
VSLDFFWVTNGENSPKQTAVYISQNSGVSIFASNTSDFEI